VSYGDHQAGPKSRLVSGSAPDYKPRHRQPRSRRDWLFAVLAGAVLIALAAAFTHGTGFSPSARDMSGSAAGQGQTLEGDTPVPQYHTVLDEDTSARHATGTLAARRYRRLERARAARKAARAAAAQVPAPQPVATPAPAQSVPATSTAPAGISSFEACVIAHESGGNPTAVNPTSGAGGLFQFLLSSWLGTPYGSQYPSGAQTAPASAQYAAFQWEYAHYGSAPWAGDGCA